MAGTARAGGRRAGQQLDGQQLDGRRERGRRRRAALLDAALRVIQRDGIAALTHRAAAAEAGLAPTVATYYFATVDDLLAAASSAAAERFARAARDRIPPTATLRDLARLLAGYLREDRAAAVAEYELYLLAARRPALRPAALCWTGAAEALLRRFTDDDTAVRAGLAACDGLLVQGLVADRPPDAEQVEQVLARILRPATTG